jgi:DNA repair protein RecN (Recombination protein N)
VQGLLKKALKILDKDPLLFGPALREGLAGALAQVEEALALANDGSDQLGPEDLEPILTRLDTYQRLKGKYRLQTGELAGLMSSCQKELDEINNLDGSIQALSRQREGLRSTCQSLALRLRAQRTKAAHKLSKELTSALRSMNMEGANIRMELLEAPLGPAGLDHIQVMAETNPGEGFHLLKDMASGGELSRILLATRQILSAQNSISIFLFDEIDTGIGGQTAVKIGKSLKKVSESSQVVAITHLPQIAHYADQLILVQKDVEREGRTKSHIQHLSGSKRAPALASMLGDLQA